MKIIYLLNKIANGEEVIIKDGANKYHYSDLENDFITGMGYNYEHYFSNIDNILDCLNDEVEIIEEKEIKHFEPDIENDTFEFVTSKTYNKEQFNIQKKLNEIIDYLNSKGE